MEFGEGLGDLKGWSEGNMPRQGSRQVGRKAGRQQSLDRNLRDIPGDAGR